MSYFKEMSLDRRIKGRKCEKRRHNEDCCSPAPWYPCSVCINRPTRRKDHDMFEPQLTPEQERENIQKKCKESGINY